MKQHTWIILAMLALALSAGAAYAADLTADQIAKKSLDLDKSQTKKVDYTMTVTNEKGKTKTYEFTAWEREFDTGTKKILRFSKPADSNGIGLLSWERKGKDDQQWLFLPAVGKARQLAASDKDDKFMASDLFYEDMGSMVAENFNHTLLQQVVLDGHQCYLIETKPKPSYESSYGTIRSWIDTTSFIGYKMELYGKNGKLIKTVFNRQHENVSGRWTVKRLEAVTAGGGKAKTVVEIRSIVYDSEVPEQMLTQKALETK